MASPKIRKRLRAAKPGELVVQYGRLDGDAPDVVYSWMAPAARCDNRLVYNVMGSERLSINREPEGGAFQFNKSFLEELEARGYDLRTLQFSIFKKEVTGG